MLLREAPCSRLSWMQSWMLTSVLMVFLLLSGCMTGEGTGKMSEEASTEQRPPIRITVVRHDDREGRELLRFFTFGGFRGPRRVPRGINPELVSRFFQEELKPDSIPEAYAKMVEVLRFYETADCLPYLRHVLTGKEQTVDDIRRSAYVIHALAEVGTQEESEEAAQYFDSNLVGHPKAFEAVHVLLATLVVLSPSGSPDRLSERIDDEVNAKKVHEKASEEARSDYQKVAAIQRLQLPNALAAAEAKKKVLAMKGADQLAELVVMYMGTSNVSDEFMMTWAARMLRRQAIEEDPCPIYEAFAKDIAKANPKEVGKDPMTDTLVSRAAQAILYLQGTLTETERALYEKTKLGAMNFLWDDLRE